MVVHSPTAVAGSGLKAVRQLNALGAAVIDPVALDGALDGATELKQILDGTTLLQQILQNVESDEGGALTPKGHEDGSEEHLEDIEESMDRSLPLEEIERRLLQLKDNGVVLSIVRNDKAIAALKSDGSVTAWGNASDGGDCHHLQQELNGGVQSIYHTNRAFAALKANGSVLAWGDDFCGGDCSSVQKQLASGVQTIHSADYAFVAIKRDGSVVAWGHENDRGDCGNVHWD